MERGRLVETFNTHRMAADVVRALATGREVQLETILDAIRRALASRGPNGATNPQHLVVYGERGSGKSFLMRMVQLEVEALAAAGEPVAMALLPEEQHNVDSEARLLEALAANLEGRSFAYSVDRREPQTAWAEAQDGLAAALDRRFGKGAGLLIAGVENFDSLSRDIFGTGRQVKARVAVEQRAAEERLRVLLNRPEARLMLLATATRTVDMDYERPLFQAFASLDLTPWTPEHCIDYFNRRRALEGAAPLTPRETARARAVAEFIGGNPRLAQLLGEVLASPDAKGVSSILDALVDELADYYKDRLGDLPRLSRGLLDALIVRGEPCTQSELAARVNQQQNQIADAFGYLRDGRLLIGERELGGRGQLYRVRDRLFVHFYRRRNAPEARLPGGAGDLARIAELLETFYTAEEKAEQALRHLDAGELDAAQLYLDLRRREVGDGEGFSWYRDQDDATEPCVPFLVPGVAGSELEPLRVELRDRPEDAYRRWSDRANAPGEPLTRAAAEALRALAASRIGDDGRAETILRDALAEAERAEDADARVLLLDQLAFLVFWRQRNWRTASDFSRQAGNEARMVRSELLRAAALADLAWSLTDQGRYPAAIGAADEAAECARISGSSRLQAMALRYKGAALGSAGRSEEAIVAFDQALDIAIRSGHEAAKAQCLRGKGWSLHRLGRNQEAIAVFEQANALSERCSDGPGRAQAFLGKGMSLGQLQRHEEALDALDRAIALSEQSLPGGGTAKALQVMGWSLGQLGRHDEAVAVLRRAAAVAEDVDAVHGQAESTRHLAWSLWWLQRYTEALDSIRTAVALADRHGDRYEALRAHWLYFQVAAETPIQDLLARIEVALALPLEDEADWLAQSLRDIVSAVTLNDVWPGFAAIMRRNAERAANARPTILFDRVGSIWASRARAEGRAAVFASVTDSLPAILDVMTLVPTMLSQSVEQARIEHMMELVDGLVGACDDPGLLRDIADLLPETIGPDNISESDRMRAFADYHAAPDKAAFLQRCDPDLATAMRSIWERSA